MSTRKHKRILSLIHSYGFSRNYELRTWFKNVRRYVKDRLKNYNEILDMWNKNKALQKQKVYDPRIHLCLYFIKWPSCNEKELSCIKSLSKIVNVVPVIINDNSFPFNNFNAIQEYKQHFQEILAGKNIRYFNFQEDDLVMKQFKSNLIAQTTPFYIQIRNGTLDCKTSYSDLHILIKILTTPYINTYYYRTELIWNRFMHKQRMMAKKEKSKDGSQNLGLGIGMAVGLGVMSALYTLKNRLL